jgi:hypothetical protein
MKFLDKYSILCLVYLFSIEWAHAESSSKSLGDIKNLVNHGIVILYGEQLVSPSSNMSQQHLLNSSFLVPHDLNRIGVLTKQNVDNVIHTVMLSISGNISRFYYFGFLERHGGIVFMIANQFLDTLEITPGNSSVVSFGTLDQHSENEIQVTIQIVPSYNPYLSTPTMVLLIVFVSLFTIICLVVVCIIFVSDCITPAVPFPSVAGKKLMDEYQKHLLTQQK